MTWQTLRTVVEELDVEQLVDVLSEKHARFAEAWDGIKWLLCRSPDLKGGAQKHGSGGSYRVFVFAGDVLADTPDIWVVYTFTEDEVTILGVTTAPRAEPTEEDGLTPKRKTARTHPRGRSKGADK